MVEEMLPLAASSSAIRACKFGQEFANRIRRRLPAAKDKWQLDEVCLMISGTKHWLWRAVDREAMVLDIVVQKRRDKRAAKRLLHKLIDLEAHLAR